MEEDQLFKFAKYGCLVVALFVLLSLIFSVVGTYLFVRKAGDFIHDNSGKVVVMAAKEAINRSSLSQDEKESALVPIKEFEVQVENGQVSVVQAGAVGANLLKGPLRFLLAARDLESDLANDSQLTSSEREEAEVVMSRFSRGLALGRISSDSPSAQSMNSENKDIRQMVEEMRQAADRAQIEDREFQKIDLAEVISAAIADGMSN